MDEIFSNFVFGFAHTMSKTLKGAIMSNIAFSFVSQNILNQLWGMLNAI